MTVLVAKANEEIIKKMYPSVKFEECTKNTSTFKITFPKFEKLLTEARLAGYNPYHLFTW